MKKGILLYFLAFSFLLPYLHADAAIFVTKDEYTLQSTESVLENLYVASDSVSIHGKVSGDVFAVGRSLLIQGGVAGDVFLAGSQLTLFSFLPGDIRVAGENVLIASSTGGDLIAFGSTVRTRQGITVSGDTIVSGKQVFLEGTFSKDVTVHAGEAVLDGLFKGDVTVRARNLIIKTGTVISGTLDYKSPKQALMEDEVNINEVVFKEADFGRVMSKNILSFLAGFFILKFFAFTFASLMFFFIFRRFIEMSAVEAVEYPGKALWTGFVFSILFPLLILVLSVSLVGSLAGIALFSVFSVFVCVATIISPIILGVWAHAIFKRDQSVLEYLSWKSIILGVLLSSVLTFIPVLGWIALLISFFMSTGVIVCVFYQRVWLNR